MQTYDRDYTYVRGRRVLHTVLVRDWLCGECYSNLVTMFFDQEPHWRTVCAEEYGHSPDKFIHQGTVAYIEHEILMQQAEAEEIFKHLPADLQQAITNHRKEKT